MHFPLSLNQPANLCTHVCLNHTTLLDIFGYDFYSNIHMAYYNVIHSTHYN